MDIAIYLHAMTALFVIIDPIGAALIFNSLVGNGDKKYRYIMATKAIIISGLTLILFGNYGEALFSHLGININSLRISGGLLLFFTAFQMITSDMSFSSKGEQTDISVFPMSIPLLAGPGTLTLALLLFSQTTETAGIMAVSAAIISTLLLTFVLMLVSKHLKKVIGKTGDEILKRFLGVILAALAIQFIYDGIRNLMA
ncbi:MarC family protein [Psychromonas sp. Urea-02u-13]|uniref:MarC family protein n=1 Tax=Psychromonas sp. Urea-02u-13 TaxID=2058326 RepID=UPI000C31FDD9|nr:MarC family protein [Psychromonas sp. Urea-02u-13]PKG40272.1 MarC family protein [Psychromonas sp. Urea-02u-13]